MCGEGQNAVRVERVTKAVTKKNHPNWRNRHIR